MLVLLVSVQPIFWRYQITLTLLASVRYIWHNLFYDGMFRYKLRYISMKQDYVWHFFFCTMCILRERSLRWHLLCMLVFLKVCEKCILEPGVRLCWRF